MSKRVVAYCRVSTDNRDQANSLASQKQYFKSYIERTPEWELVGVFSDEGITGTSTKKRQAFQEMITACEQGNIDLIITKEISRFARNTLDSIFYTRKLKALGVGVYFLNDNINTLDPDSELRLTIMSSIAQEESRKTSQRVKWGQKRRMEQGVTFGNGVLGYTIKDGRLIINQEEAETVRLIFHFFVNEGMGCLRISKELMNRGLLTSRGNAKWSHPSIYKILANEKYVGDLKQKKFYTPDYLSHAKIPNQGQEEYVYIKDHHEPIIERYLFEKAQCMMKERGEKFPEERSRYSNRYAFSGKIKCGKCGERYLHRTARPRNDGSMLSGWRCSSAVRFGKPHVTEQNIMIGCDAKSVSDELLHIMIQSIVADIASPHDRLIAEIETTIEYALKATCEKEPQPVNRKQEIQKLKEQKQTLIQLYLDGLITADDMRAVTSKQEEQINRLELQLQEQRSQTEKTTDVASYMKEVRESIQKITSGSIFSDSVCTEIIRQIIVGENSRFNVFLQGNEQSLFFNQNDIILSTPWVPHWQWQSLPCWCNPPR